MSIFGACLFSHFNKESLCENEGCGDSTDISPWQSPPRLNCHRGVNSQPLWEVRLLRNTAPGRRSSFSIWQSFPASCLRTVQGHLTHRAEDCPLECVREYRLQRPAGQIAPKDAWGHTHAELTAAETRETFTTSGRKRCSWQHRLPVLVLIESGGERMARSDEKGLPGGTVAFCYCSHRCRGKRLSLEPAAFWSGLRSRCWQSELHVFATLGNRWSS